MRDKPASQQPTAFGYVPPPQSAEAARREQAMARFILRRVGIPPLAAIALALMFAVPADRVDAQTVATRATATARATIVSSSVRIEQGRVTISDGVTRPSVPVVARPKPRPCEETAAQPTCRLIVTDLP